MHSRHDLLSWGTGVRSESLHQRLTKAIEDELAERELESEVAQLEQWRAVQLARLQQIAQATKPVESPPAPAEPSSPAPNTAPAAPTAPEADEVEQHAIASLLLHAPISARFSPAGSMSGGLGRADWDVAVQRSSALLSKPRSARIAEPVDPHVQTVLEPLPASSTVANSTAPAGAPPCSQVHGVWSCGAAENCTRTSGWPGRRLFTVRPDGSAGFLFERGAESSALAASGSAASGQAVQRRGWFVRVWFEGRVVDNGSGDGLQAWMETKVVESSQQRHDGGWVGTSRTVGESNAVVHMRFDSIGPQWHRMRLTLLRANGLEPALLTQVDKSELWMYRDPSATSLQLSAETHCGLITNKASSLDR